MAVVKRQIDRRGLALADECRRNAARKAQSDTAQRWVYADGRRYEIVTSQVTE